VQPYPAQETLQGNLKTTVDWNLYKKRLIREVKKERVRVRALGSKNY
jgi:hypothetical protein